MATDGSQRLYGLIDELIRLSAPENRTSPQASSYSLSRINLLVTEYRTELNKDSTPRGWTQPSSRDNLSPGEANAIVDGRISPSLHTPTVNIDVSPPTSSNKGFGFIDAIKLAALNVEQSHSEPITIPASSSTRLSVDTSAVSDSSADSRHSEQTRNLSQTNATLSDTVSQTSSDVYSQSPISSSPAMAHLAPPYLSSGPGAPLPLSSSNRQRYFRKCFPVYRKLFIHGTKSKRFLSQKSRMFVPAISPDTLHMALVCGPKYSIYSIPEDYNDSPKLKFEGTVFGETASQHRFIAMNDFWLVIASHDGKLAVISLESGGLIYQRDLKFGVDALDISNKGAIIAVAIAGIDRSTKVMQPMVILICPSTMFSSKEAFEHVDTITFTSPYTDMIKTIAVNSQESAIVCSTDRESRFFVISLADYREPRILLRSSRKAPPVPEDDDLRSSDQRPEGITGVKFLPNSQFLLLASFAPGSPPVIVDTKLSLSKVQTDNKVSQMLVESGQPQVVIMRFEKMGSSIQSCQASPKGSGAAFADISGAIYVVNLPSVSTDSRKISLCLEVAAGNTMLYAPAMRFTPDGTALLVLDRKGDLHVADFGAGHPQQPGIMRAKVLA